eukprot:8946781-Alexandrium_andersonii.AAC.1
MSASLVGSEMCIRDRFMMRESVIAASNIGVKSSDCAWITGTSASARLSPVSYTHLTLPTICSV